jgi:ABC-type sugar transport system ATPase subunit
MISHNMNDVRGRTASRLRLGRLVSVRPTAELDKQIVVDLMTTGESTRTVDP